MKRDPETGWLHKTREERLLEEARAVAGPEEEDQ